MLTASPSKPTRSAVPTFEPITLDELKKAVELPQSYTYHDGHLNTLIQVAREMVEHDTGIVTATGTYTWKLDAFPAGSVIEFPVRPVSSITSIVTVQSDGSSSTWSSAEYSLDANRTQPSVVLGYNYSWPTVRGHLGDITITFVAGYASREAIPRMIRQAVILAAAREFADREGQSEAIAAQFTLAARSYEMLITRLCRSTYP